MKYRIAVRELCEFAAKTGDLDRRFTPAPSAEEGIAGHAVVVGRRGQGYQSEVSLSGEFGVLQIRGRCDGYDPVRQQLEEIKTYRGDLMRMPANHRALHWAQAKIYAHLLCLRFTLPAIKVALVYFDIVRQTETEIIEECSAATLQTHFDCLCGRFLAWAEAELKHRRARDQSLQALAFPYRDFNKGQRELATAVFKAASSGRCLMLQAPTGIGKTMGTLFPMLKAMPPRALPQATTEGAKAPANTALDKIFFLAAKTSGRQLALDAMTTIQSSSPALRILEMVARDKACIHPEKNCHGDSCPLAQGFYDRLPDARAAAVNLPVQDQAGVAGLASAHQICPYYLSQDLARWADVIIGDYNYFFDSSALLYGLMQANQWRAAVLVDEAHNLIERGRKMYSAELSQHALKSLRHDAPAAIRKPLDRLQRAWSEFNSAQAEAYQAYEVLPAKLLNQLQQCCHAISEFLGDNPLAMNPSLQRFYFDALQFTHLAEQFDTHSLFDASQQTPPRAGQTPYSSLCIRNVIPAPFLAPRFAASQTTVLFSATLSPWNFYHDTLGLPDNAPWIEVDSPFDEAQLAVHVIDHISTRYQARTVSLQPIARLIASQYMKSPGNYLAFFSSFEYLQQVLAVLQTQAADIPVWAQARQMNEADRKDFLLRFEPDGQGIGFAVLGGAFAEGIDLPGKRLIGAFIATLGLPQINPVNEQIRQRMQVRFGNGYDYTYLYPGLQKVVQAAGRVIRNQDDRGVLILIDDRYNQPQIRSLLPVWWKVRQADRIAAGSAPDGNS